MEIPAVRNHGEWNVESFDSYYLRWPVELSNFPKSVVESWVYRHWLQFEDLWLRLDAAYFRFDRATFTNQQVMQIGHFPDWFRTLDYWGDELFTDEPRRDTWLAKFMLREGTTPTPIIIAFNAVGVEHPMGGQLETPTHLVEGHMRLAYLRGMIRHKHPALKPTHVVWLLTIPKTPGLNSTQRPNC